MKRIAITGLAIGLTTLLAGCGWSDPVSLERAVADAGRMASDPHGAAPSRGQSSLPPGHPLIGQGHGVLPPGHPPIPQGLTCPARGADRNPAGERFRAPGTGPHQIISI